MRASGEVRGFGVVATRRFVTVADVPAIPMVMAKCANCGQPQFKVTLGNGPVIDVECKRCKCTSRVTVSASRVDSLLIARR